MKWRLLILFASGRQGEKAGLSEGEGGGVAGRATRQTCDRALVAEQEQRKSPFQKVYSSCKKAAWPLVNRRTSAMNQQIHTGYMRTYSLA